MPRLRTRSHSTAVAVRRARRRATPSSRAADAAPVLIRPAAPADARVITRLGILDGHELPRGEHLVGVLEGDIVAAIDIGSGAAVADPFVPTVGVVELLGLRAAQVRR